jgi:hypothetical protein
VHLRREIVMDGPQSVSFARHVHEVVDLDAHGASPETIEARVDAMHADREERSALWELASSLHHSCCAPTQAGDRRPRA